MGCLVLQLVVTSMLSVSFAVFLRIKVAELEVLPFTFLDKFEFLELQLVLMTFTRFVLFYWQAVIINLRRSCNGNDDVVYHDSVKVLQPDDANSISYFSNDSSRTVALYTVVMTLPFLLFKCLDNIFRIKAYLKKTQNNEEEAPLKKRIAYRVDVFFSVYPYAKLLALLFATVLLISFGGLALYSVSDGGLFEALWLSWTFVADSGNHAEMVGTGPRIVSVSISSGGMLIFAMMLGLVSDAISEKVDSWRKGKSEVIEKNHILILGWSDKLVIHYGNLILHTNFYVQLLGYYFFIY